MMYLNKSGQATQRRRTPAAIENLSIHFPLICTVIEHGEKSEELRVKSKYVQDISQCRSVNYVEGNVEVTVPAELPEILNEEPKSGDMLMTDMIKENPDEKFGQDGKGGDSSVTVAHKMVTLPLL